MGKLFGEREWIKPKFTFQKVEARRQAAKLRKKGEQVRVVKILGTGGGLSGRLGLGPAFAVFHRKPIAKFPLTQTELDQRNKELRDLRKTARAVNKSEGIIGGRKFPLR